MSLLLFIIQVTYQLAPATYRLEGYRYHFVLGCFSTSNNQNRLMSSPILMDMLSQDFWYRRPFIIIADQALSKPKLSKYNINS